MRQNRHSKQSDDPCTGNLADQIQYLTSTMHTSKFVQRIVHTSGKVPAIILCTDDQISDINRVCCKYPLCPVTVLCVDKTFNLTDLHVTLTVNKNLAIYRQGTSQHPLFLGPMVIHGNSDTDTFSVFFDYLKSKLISNPVLGSDDEFALRRAMSSAFPDSAKFACMRHLKNNVISFLRDKQGCDKALRNSIVHLVFGKNGLTESEDLVTFNHRLQNVYKHTGPLTLFDKYFRDRVEPLLRNNFVAAEQVPSVPMNWTNNNAESMNHVIKQFIQWKGCALTKLVKNLEAIVSSQFQEVRRALSGAGSFVLSPQYVHFLVNEYAWLSMSKEARDRHYEKFMKHVHHLQSNTSFSRDGSFSCFNSSSKGKKPGQRKRKRSARTASKPKRFRFE